MRDSDIVHFFSSEENFPKAAEIFNREKEKLVALFPYVDIQHVGSCAILGAIGKFDVDIQIRIPQDRFTEIIEVMCTYATEKHLHLWNKQFAIFKDHTDFIDYVITVIDSRYDDFYRTRDYLIAHPDMLEKYNVLKRSCEGKSYAEYREAKKEFLGTNGAIKFLKY